MYIYILFFLLSFFFIYIAKKYEKMKAISTFFEIISIALLSFLAAIRDESIGTDVNTYVKPIFETFVQYGKNAFEVGSYFNVELGYNLFNYIISIFTDKFYILLFFIQFFILTFSFWGIKKMYPKNYVLAYSIFILIAYNRSLNIVRQLMAIALCVYALSYLFKENYKKFFFIVIIASIFHSSSLIFLVIYIIYKLVLKKNMNQYLLSMGIFGFGFILFMFFEPLINIFVNLHLFSSKYIYYLTNYVSNSLNFNLIEIAIDVFFIFIYLIFSKVYNSKDKRSKLYFVLLVVDLTCLIISSRYSSAYRISMYFNIPTLVYFLSNFKLILNEKNDKNFITSLIGIFIAFIYWYVLYVMGNAGNTVPFISAL